MPKMGCKHLGFPDIMNNPTPLLQPRFEFTCESAGCGDLAVVAWDGIDAISRIFRFSLVLAGSKPSSDLTSMLAAPACLRMRAGIDAAAIEHHGLIASFEQMHQADGYVFYRAELVPRVWRLGMSQGCRTYQREQPIPDTIVQILRRAGLGPADVETRLRAPYRPRSFVCQYHESDLDFICRWLEREGIYFHFEHAQGRDRLILLDHRGMQSPSLLALRYLPDDIPANAFAPDGVRTLSCRVTPLPRTLVLHGYNHRKAALALRAAATVSERGVGEVIHDDANIRDPDEAARYARLRAEELACTARMFRGESTAMGLRAGTLAALQGHACADFNTTFLITEVHHRGTQAGALLDALRGADASIPSGNSGYHNSFVAIPADTQFRPARRTPTPRAQGAISARVTRDPRDAMDIDPHGQYLVRLPFAQDAFDAGAADAPDTRVRLVSPYAGKGHGLHFPLQDGTEVLLGFVDADPDRPVILGALPNSEHASMATAAAPRDNHLDTAGGNHLRFHDTPGRQAVWLHSPTGSTTIGLGAATPSGANTLWSSTSGSSVSFVVGAKHDMMLGESKKLTLADSSEISASIRSAFTLQSEVRYNASSSIQWNCARGISVSDGHTTDLSARKSIHAHEGVRLSSGNGSRAALMLAARQRVRMAVVTYLATMAAISAVAAERLARQASLEQGDPTRALPPGEPASLVATALEPVLGAMATGMVHLIVSRIVRNAAEHGPEGAPSTVDIEPERIGMRVAPSAATQSTMELRPGTATLATTDSAEDPAAVADLSLQPGQAHLEARRDARTSSLDLIETQATLATPDCRVSLTPQGVRATAGGTRLELARAARRIELTQGAAALTLDDGAASLMLGSHGLRVRRSDIVLMSARGPISIG